MLRWLRSDNGRVAMVGSAVNGLPSTGTKKSSPRYDECLQFGKGYMAKYWCSSTVNCERLLVVLQVKNPKHVQCKLFFFERLSLIMVCSNTEF